MRDRPTRWVVNPGFTNSAGRPVDGCTRTTGWMTGGTRLACSSNSIASSRVSAVSKGSPQ